MQDRGYIKWAPFNSLINDKDIIKEKEQVVKKVNKPILSEDQLSYINDKVMDAYTNHYKVNISIYKNENIININGFINNINTFKKLITFNNTYVYFNQIISINNYIE